MSGVKTKGRHVRDRYSWFSTWPRFAGAERAQEAVSRSGVRFCALGKDGAALLEAGYPCDVLPTEPSTQVQYQPGTHFVVVILIAINMSSLDSACCGQPSRPRRMSTSHVSRTQPPCPGLLMLPFSSAEKKRGAHSVFA